VEGAQLDLGNLSLGVIETPGHTDNSICLSLQGRVLTGDTLLIGGAGRCDLQGGDAGALYDSITCKLLTLPDATVVYPGHDYAGRSASTIGEEKRLNPRLLGKTREDFVAFEQHRTTPPPRKAAEVLPLNARWGG
jgi:glyoxylase-like metal-dependent hydrolase (beta-lactamase superfamily II)